MNREHLCADQAVLAITGSTALEECASIFADAKLAKSKGSQSC
jgi:hypothetical protein